MAGGVRNSGLRTVLKDFCSFVFSWRLCVRPRSKMACTGKSPFRPIVLLPGHVAVSCVLPYIAYSSRVKTSTLTIRLSQDQREALRRCAKALKKTESEYIRELLARDLDSRTLSERIGNLAGSLDSSQTVGKPHPMKEVIRKRNWRQ